MATLEKHGSLYRIDFYFGGKRFRRTVKTESEKSALSVLARAEDTLRRLTLGQLVLPPGADVASFVLSDGRLEKQQSSAKHMTLGSLINAYRASVTNLEPTTEHCVKIHVGHFRRVFGEKFPLRSMDLASLQQYVDAWTAAKGLRGKSLSTTTIKKELGPAARVRGPPASQEGPAVSQDFGQAAVSDDGGGAAESRQRRADGRGDRGPVGFGLPDPAGD